jgi:beta-lactamase superfamily II metal-dependent hydrolase
LNIGPVRFAHPPGSAFHLTAVYLRVARANKDPRPEAGSVVLTVFPQTPEDFVEENNNSVGLRVRYGAFTALLPGDAQDEERRWWMGRVPELCTGCTVLKLAHHGSRNGTDSRWIDLVRPRLAVASLGRGNEYGHPHPEVLALLGRGGPPAPHRPRRHDRDPE